MLKVIFHLNHDLLQLGLISFRARCVNFTPHFLSDKAQFLSLPLSIVKRLNEIVQVILQSDFFLGYIELFNIKNQLLFQAILVVIDILKLLQLLNNARLYFLGS